MHNALSLQLRSTPIVDRKRQRASRARNASIGLAAAAVVSLMSPPAYAEGGFDSSLSHVRTGYQSRIWSDRNLDGNSTTTTMSVCSRDDGAQFRMNVELRKQRSGLPDVSYGTRDLSSCNRSSPTGNWGNPGSGSFFDQFFHQDFGTASANYVGVRY